MHPRPTEKTFQMGVRDAKKSDPGMVRRTPWPLLAAPDCHPKKYGLKRGTSAVLNPLEAAYADRRIERFSYCVERSVRYYDALVADFRFWMSE
jgi:hypothetical protein